MVTSSRENALNEIANQVQQLLDWHERERKAEDLPCNDNTHVMRFPVYPTRGQLKSWVQALKIPNK